MRKKVNATAIHDRISELHCEMPPQKELNCLLNSSDMFIANKENPKTYSLTTKGIDCAQDIVNSHIEKPSRFNIPLEVIIFLITALFSLLGLVFRFAYYLGTQKPVVYE